MDGVLGVVKVKSFYCREDKSERPSTPASEVLEEEIQKWITSHQGSIKNVDVKYSTDATYTSNGICCWASALVTYEEVL